MPFSHNGRRTRQARNSLPADRRYRLSWLHRVRATILSQCVIATIGGCYTLASVPLGERERDALLGSICVHNTFDLGRTIPSKSEFREIILLWKHLRSIFFLHYELFSYRRIALWFIDFFSWFLWPIVYTSELLHNLFAVTTSDNPHRLYLSDSFDNIGTVP